MLEDIFDGGKFNPSVNRREARYKIRDFIKRIQTEWKGALLYTRNVNKVLHKVFRYFMKRFCKFCQFWVNLDQKFLI